MHPSNPFGRPQSGAFQAPNNTMKTGLFQSVGQQSSNTQPQTMDVFQPSAFGQPPGSIQTSSHGVSVFGQAPTFGQPSALQAPTFGQTSVGKSSSGFGSSTAPAFGQTNAPNQGSVFGQAPAFGQTSGFGQQGSGFGGFGQPQMTSGSNTTIGQPKPLGFGQPAFGQTTSTSVTSIFGSGTSLTQSTPFGSSKFSFKPANEALFKPISSASSEPNNPQTSSMSSTSFGTNENQTSSSSQMSSGTFGVPDFTFSVPVAAPSISTHNTPLTAINSSSSMNPLQFTFSQPAAPSSSSTTKASISQPTTPSSFSFSLKPQTVASAEGTVFGQRPAFGDTKGQAESVTDEKRSHPESLEDTNVFARLGKGTKRKEDLPVPSIGQEQNVTKDDAPAEGDSPRQPPKRPLMRSQRPPGALFGRALSGLRKETTNLGRRDVTRDTVEEVPKWENAKRDGDQGQGDNLTAAQPRGQAITKGVLERDKESAQIFYSEPGTSSPVKRDVRSESVESLGGLSPADCTILHCRKIPSGLNKKNIIEKHFARFGKVLKVICRPAKTMAIVHFDDHVSAARAKKKGKILHQHELILFWQRKKQSPSGKTSRSTAEDEEAVDESPECTESRAVPPTFTKSPLKTLAGSSTTTFGRSSPAKKMTSAKSLQFNTEAQKVSSTESQSSERPVPSSLVHLIGQVADTAEDKFRLLEQKDKILRQGRPKRTDLSLSKVFVGTCPDMCPEKERYMRETRNQLSIFEVFPDTEMVDHTAAIKEYSRSSADQEEPLPHDLRPLPVLSMTMDYLVTHIMDQGHDNYRDWYDFVWNRTRGIRKDITQQDLCCPHTVSLIEKCTRFHVHCAHHLCEEQMSAFDAKINNENMTKCLQSLKEMYQDLATRQIYCPQEAEFRQYSVLLRLNDGDILREVQQFRDEVRNSHEVKFAVQAFAAVNSNNFVRFFKLVKRASYLASCILHRYFNQVRAKGLKILNIAHSGPRSTMFPVEDITRMFMFHDTIEATDFVQQYGLNVIDCMAELSRTAYRDPELPRSQKKSQVILSKKTVLIGEVVNGGSLPNPPQHNPICSFDSQNKYRGEGPLAESTMSGFKAVTINVEVKVSPRIESPPQAAPALDSAACGFVLPPVVTIEPIESHHSLPVVADVQPLFLPIPEPVKSPSPPPPPPPPAPPAPVYSDEEIRTELEIVIDEVLGTALMEVAEDGATFAKAVLVESNVQVEALVSEVLDQMLREVSSSEIKLEQERVAEEKRKLEEARRKQEHEAFLSQVSASVCTEIIHEVVDESIKETSTTAIQLAVDEKAERVAKCTEQVCNSLIEETLNADIALTVEQILDEELQLIHKYIKRWRDVVAVRRQLKRQMRGFPAAPCCVDPRFKLRAFAPSAPLQPCIADLARGVVNLGNAGTLAVSSTRLLKLRQEVIHQMRVHYFHQLMLDEMVWAPFNLPTLVTQNITDPPARIFWKLAVFLPSNDESISSPADRILSEWLEVKLGGEVSQVKKNQPDGKLQTLCVTNTVQEKGRESHIVHVSVKACRGPLSEDSLSKLEETSELNGTGALILMLPVIPVTDLGQDENNDDIAMLSALLQLKQLQQASSWHNPLPLVLLVPGTDGAGGEEQKLVEALMLQTLVQEGLISDYTLFFIPETTSDIQGSKQLSCALHWLLARAPPPIPLSCQSLVDLVEATLSHEFSARVHSLCQERAAARLPSQEPAAIIQLYNTVLAHVADTVSSGDLCKLSWPPAEFCLPDNQQFIPQLGFNSPQHLEWLSKVVLSLQLPPWEQLSNTESWSELCSSIYSYAAQIPVSHHSQPLLMSRLENLLQRFRVKCHRAETSRSSVTMKSFSCEVESLLPAWSLVPWEVVVEIFIDSKLKDWQIPEPVLCREDGEILVYFHMEALKGFQPPDEWREALRQTHREKQQQQQEQDERRGGAAAYISPSLRQRLFHSVAEPPEHQTAPMDITHTPTSQELLAHNLLQSVEKEKAESKRSMEQLQRWLDGDPLDPLSTPLFIPSSTLLSMPKTIVHAPTAKKHGGVAEEPDDLSEKAEWPKSVPVSLEWRMKELERQILASREEELACKLELSSLLNIVDD